MKATITSEPSSSYLRRIYSPTEITIDATDGKNTIAGATDTFGLLYGNFTCRTIGVEGKPAPAIPVCVYELTKCGVVPQIFADLGREPGSLCLSQDQIVWFCRNLARWIPPCNGTFFLFRTGEEFVTADVARVAGQKFSVGLNYLLPSPVWCAARPHRFVLP